MARPRLATILVAVAWCTSCSTPPPTDEEMVALISRMHAAASARTLDESFIRDAEPLGGSLPAEVATDGFRVGDRLLFGVESFDGDVVTRWLLRFETLEGESADSGAVELAKPAGRDTPAKSITLQSPRASVQVTLLDAEGHLVARDRSTVATTIQSIGLFCYARAEAGQPGAHMRTLAHASTARPLWLRDIGWGYGVFGHLLDLIRRNGATQRLARAMSIAPGLLELPQFLGSSIHVEAGLNRPKVVPQPIDGVALGQDAMQFSSSFWNSSGPLCEVVFVVVPPIGPLGMTAGIVTAAGYRPKEPERRFVLRLIGMEQGEPTDRESR